MFDQFIQFLITGITVGSIYALVGLGFALIYNASDVVNFAQGEFVMIGAMSAIFLHMSGVPYFLAIIIAVLISMLVGMALEKLAIEQARNATVVTTIIITIGASIFLRGAALLIWGKDIYGFPPISGDDPIKIGNVTVLPQSLWIIAGTCVFVIGLRYFFQNTLIGKAILACSYNKKAAYLMGIEVKKMLLIAYGISALLGGIAGVLIAPITYMTYGAGVMLGLKGFCASILGGMGNSMGAVIGGLILGIVESLGAGFISSGYKDAISFFIILLVLFFKPTGLFGKSGMERV
ncbi:High-affinity branched-chain amino acid transport system permease protein LivH [Dissulfuribacter thermophilus]|uniref:High-affinity branched-chain amino acid transport system permease protein LivH n=1 Tax=Dissulfuribacter thermophilus TaxID=1156395 RepID=A0A1B9F4Q6_9BACT|nr:branched-chain amino acid ABC transporter permease [Dissulfuribacter thermophilus]OCC14939.1 High-affinity branched-chain amino acid transport system permease protein LivH [Dissulfuribacter thermophilus]